MAEIFLARPNPALATPALLARRSPLVVKRLFAHHSSQADFVRMFFNEARLAARIKHPNIVDIFDQGEEDGTYFLAMEYIHGEDLRGLAQQSDLVSRRPPYAIICRIIIDILDGLHYAHTLLDDRSEPLGLVHRDVSPQNVLVTYDGVVKLIDFGIAKATRALDSEQTQAGTIKGKYAYMSPEQTRGEPLDARSDVFSTGTLLWELLTWRRLFKRATDLATLVAVTEEPAPPAQAVQPDIPKELDEITLRALTMSRDDRWASAKEFRDALATFIENQGWDASREALGRYMTEIFASKLAARAREATPSPIEERASAGLPVGVRASTRPPSTSSLPLERPAVPAQRVRMTMPLQIINPALAQQARKAMVVPKSQSSLPSGQSGTQDAVGKSQLRSTFLPGAQQPPSARSGAGNRPVAAAPQSLPDSGSLPMRIQPDSASSLRQPPGPPTAPSRSSLPAVPVSTAPSAAALRPLPADLGGGVVMAASDDKPTAPMAARPSQPPPETLRQRRVILAVAIGIIIGVLAVVLLQLLASHRGR